MTEQFSGRRGIAGKPDRMVPYMIDADASEMLEILIQGAGIGGEREGIPNQHHLWRARGIIWLASKESSAESKVLGSCFETWEVKVSSIM